MQILTRGLIVCDHNIDSTHQPIRSEALEVLYTHVQLVYTRILHLDMYMQY